MASNEISPHPQQGRAAPAERASGPRLCDGDALRGDARETLWRRIAEQAARIRQEPGR